MDRSSAVDGLTSVLADAAGRADWDRLGSAVRELAPTLQALAAAGPWNGAERAALLRLHNTHATAARAVAAAAAGLQARIDDMLANKEGWIAYALADEPHSELTE